MSYLQPFPNEKGIVLKIFKRSTVIRNIILHILMSMLYLHIIEALSGGHSAVKLSFLKTTLLEHNILLTLLALALAQIYRVSTLAPTFFVVFCGGIFFSSIEIFFLTFNKVILALNFFYIGVSFISYIMLKSELFESIYVPGFHKNSVNKFSEYNIQATIKSSAGKEVPGYLTNWGSLGCFFMPMTKSLLRGRVEISFVFGEKEFISSGRVMTSYGDGYGISLAKVKGKKGRLPLGWLEFYDIIKQRGYAPRNQ
jgi:hypothetical protein